MVDCLCLGVMAWLTELFDVDNIVTSKYRDNALFEAKLAENFPSMDIFSVEKKIGKHSMSNKLTTFCPIASVQFIQNMYVVMGSDNVVKNATEELKVKVMLECIFPVQFRSAIARTCPQSTKELIVTMHKLIKLMKDKDVIASLGGLVPGAGHGGGGAHPGGHGGGGGGGNGGGGRPRFTPRHTAPAASPAHSSTVQTDGSYAALAQPSIRVTHPHGTCFNCGAVDHFVGDCRKPCTYCPAPIPSHICCECPNKPKRKVAKVASSGDVPSQRELLLEQRVADLSAKMANFMTHAVSKRAAASAVCSVDSSVDSILVDSGCTGAFINDQLLLDDFQPNSVSSLSNPSVSVANGLSERITGTVLSSVWQRTWCLPSTIR
jgi:hypothetical protein